MKKTFRGVEIELETAGAMYVARATVPTRYGPVMVQVNAPKVMAHDLVAVFPSLLSSGEDAEVFSGDFFRDMAKGLNAVTKNKTFGEITKIVSQVADNPLLQGAAGMLGGPMGTAVLGGIGGAAKAANSLATRARKGDRVARDSIRKLKARAQAGDQKAQRATRMVLESLRAQVQAPPAPAAAPFPMAVPVDMGAYASFVEAMQVPETFVQLADGSVVPELAAGGGACLGFNGARRWPVPDQRADLFTRGPGRLEYVLPVYQTTTQPPPVAHQPILDPSVSYWQ